MVLTCDVRSNGKPRLKRRPNDSTDTSAANRPVKVSKGTGTHKTPQDKRPARATLFLALSCKSFMKVTGNTVSEKSTHAATAFDG